MKDQYTINSSDHPAGWFHWLALNVSITSGIKQEDLLSYPPHNEFVAGYIGFILSVSPFVRPSVCPVSRVRSVAPTVLVGSFSYFYISSSNMGNHVAVGGISECRLSSCFSWLYLICDMFNITIADVYLQLPYKSMCTLCILSANSI